MDITYGTVDVEEGESPIPQASTEPRHSKAKIAAGAALVIASLGFLANPYGGLDGPDEPRHDSGQGSTLERSADNREEAGIAGAASDGEMLLMSSGEEPVATYDESGMVGAIGDVDGDGGRPDVPDNFGETLASFTPDNIDGGGWSVVRCVGADEGTWHPSTDNLYGTDEYGTWVDSYTSGTTFSTPYDVDDVTDFLFATSDMEHWLVAGKEQVFTIGSPLDASVTMSWTTADQPEGFSLGSCLETGPYEAYTAEWYNRPKAEDPWVSIFDHGESEPAMVFGENSKTGHMTLLEGVGACVFTR